MPSKRARRVPAFPAPWPTGTTIRDVTRFAAERIPEFILLFDAAYRKQDNAHMIENIKLLRGVVSHLDQFRRMEVRRWAKESEVNSQMEHTSP